MKHVHVSICQNQPSVKPWKELRTRRLPGVNPLKLTEWLFRDETFAQQMAYRDELIAHKRNTVFQCLPAADDIANELLNEIIQAVKHDEYYTVLENEIIRPDGVTVNLNNDHPLIVSGRLAQEDWCLLDRYTEADNEHKMLGAILCFPASWLLSEKIGRRLTAIHEPVNEYTDRIATGVQRIFDSLKPDKPVFRANFLSYNNPDLHQPRSIHDRRSKSENEMNWLRVERQTLRKLNRTSGIVFGIHTSVCPKDRIPDWYEIWT